MTRSELEHLIRAAGAIAEDSQIIVIGSQSILRQFPDAPRALLKSAEADVYPNHYPERADLIDGSIGEGSTFHETFGCLFGVSCARSDSRQADQAALGTSFTPSARMVLTIVSKLGLPSLLSALCSPARVMPVFFASFVIPPCARAALPIT